MIGQFCHSHVCPQRIPITDSLEKEFRKLQGSGGTYFINIQLCIEKLHIKQTSLFFNQNINIDDFDVKPGHQCTSCGL